MIWVLSALIAATTVALLRAEHLGARRQIYVFKPLTTALIIVLALVNPAPAPLAYRALIAAGLLWSLAGDVFLMLPSDQFLPGLGSFLVAHLCYIAAWTVASGVRWSWVALPLLAYGAVMFRILLPHLGKFRVPVIVYGVVILAMAYQALGHWQHQQTGVASLAGLGALVFVVSDSALGLNRFRKPWPSAQFVILGTYFVAQWLIALSV